MRINLSPPGSLGEKGFCSYMVFLQCGVKKNKGGERVLTLIKSLWNEERGQGMTEYGLILALLVIGVIAVLVVMGPKIALKFKNVSDNL